MLNNDNTEGRELVESCYRLKKTVLNPIIDWEDEDVWEFIHKYNLPYCKLYDEGFKRLGCIGCPMNKYTAAADLERWPTYKRAYLRACAKLIENRKKAGLPQMSWWETPEAMMDWWLDRLASKDATIAGQIEMELENDETM